MQYYYCGNFHSEDVIDVVRIGIQKYEENQNKRSCQFCEGQGQATGNTSSAVLSISY